MKQKHRQKPTQKHKTNTNTQKQKFAPKNFSKKRPLEEKNGKKRRKTPDRTQKTQNEKNGQHFPLREGGKQTLIPRQCVTVRLPVEMCPPPPSWTVLYSVPCLTIPKGHLACTGRQTDRQTRQREPQPKKHPRERRNKKNTGRAGLDLVKGAEHDVRVELGVRVHDEETLEETQTPNGVWVSPAPERERERAKKREKRRRRAYQTTKKKEGTQT